jgi:hypothetical protein
VSDSAPIPGCERSTAETQLIDAMPLRYSAFGLQLRSEFPLAGMSECDDGEGTRELRLALTGSSELANAWSGEAGIARWRGRLGDGGELSIARGPAGDVLFADLGRAEFRLDAPAGRLECAPRGAGRAWQRTLLSRILPNVALARGYEALHAGAVHASCGVVAIAGPAGAGKTTLVGELVRRGLALVSDDVLALSRRGREVVGHPGTPHMNLDRRVPLGPGQRTLAVFDHERWVAAGACTRLPQPVGAVCLLERAAGAELSAERLAATPPALAPHMLGVPDERAGRGRERFELYADLVSQAPLLRLTADLDHGVADVADALERALGTCTRGVAMQGAV